jgi:hypothetical protein
MSALRKPSLLAETLDDGDHLPGVEGILVAAAIVAALLSYLFLVGICAINLIGV